eukprot:TRINITY_DN775_c0_g1_i2.p2 TRINITY_DN775_c0_g1~~TRINITY_DN775_c0_g1_i2.p2  ORF type:complete len:116 (+),score=10.36 TRINITY_DN775_c0_g1_i2:248-595(+)
MLCCEKIRSGSCPGFPWASISGKATGRVASNLDSKFQRSRSPNCQQHSRQILSPQFLSSRTSETDLSPQFLSSGTSEADPQLSPILEQPHFRDRSESAILEQQHFRDRSSTVSDS